MADDTSPVALVTGAGTGIGRATALRLAQDGYAVALAGRRSAPLEAVADEVGSCGAAATVVAGDVSTAEGAEQAVSTTLAARRRLDVLVCNHGVGDSEPVGDDTPEGWERTMRINLTGPFLLARAALPHLLEQRGSVVTVASTNGWLAGPGWASYCTSKAGLISSPGAWPTTTAREAYAPTASARAGCERRWANTTWQRSAKCGMSRQRTPTGYAAVIRRCAARLHLRRSPRSSPSSHPLAPPTYRAQSYRSMGAPARWTAPRRRSTGHRSTYALCCATSDRTNPGRCKPMICPAARSRGLSVWMSREAVHLVVLPVVGAGVEGRG